MRLDEQQITVEDVARQVAAHHPELSHDDCAQIAVELLHRLREAIKTGDSFGAIRQNRDGSIEIDRFYVPRKP